MNKDLAQAHAHENQGQWQAAIDSYQHYLKTHPKDTQALHPLAIAAVKAQAYDQAAEALKTLVALAPESAVYHNHLANVLKQLGQYPESEQAYLNALHLNPEFVEAYNNLGVLAFQQAQFEKAETCYLKALAISPEYIDAIYNLGICYVKQSQWDKALETFKQLLKVTPNHIGAHYQLGKGYFNAGELDKAILAFKSALAINEKLPELHNNLANCYVEQKNWAEARIHFEKALDLDQQNFQAHYNLAIVSEHLANIDLAIQHYQKALKIENNDFAAHNNLGIAYLKRQNLAYALKHFEKALSLQPDNESLKYNVDAIKQDKRLEAAPTHYIKNLFDAYANNFETHIRNSLDYQVPEHLLVAATHRLKLKKNAYTILDLGCGTGLAGEVFKPYAKHMVGVDLSDNMLDVAKTKNIYDALKAEDITAFLKDKKSQYDIILAADVFVYSGKLDEILKGCKNALKRKGLLIFSTEICENQAYRVLQSGRFAHNENYLKKLAQKNRLTVRYNEIIQARMQYDEAVMGRIMALQAKRLF